MELPCGDKMTTLSCPSRTKKYKKDKSSKKDKKRSKKEKEEKNRKANDTTTTGSETSSETSSETTATSTESGEDTNKIENTRDLTNEKVADDQSGEDLGEKYTPEFLSSPTSIKWSTLEMIGSCHITKEEYFDQIETLGHGNIVYTIANGRLNYGYRDNSPDFALTKSERRRNKSLESHDIVKSMELQDFTSNGLHDDITVVGVNIDKFAGEGFIGETSTVSKILMPNQLRRMMKTGEKFSILNREIRNDVILFQNNHLGKTYKNISRDIKDISSTRCAIPLDGPIVNVFNTMNPERAITKPTKALKNANMVIVSRKMVNKYEPITVSAMKNAISYADITSENGVEVTFHCPIPPHKLEQHRLYKSSNGTKGEPWLGFFTNHKEDHLSIRYRLLTEYAKGGKEFKI